MTLKLEKVATPVASVVTPPDFLKSGRTSVGKEVTSSAEYVESKTTETWAKGCPRVL